jgi:hypothetical protein
MAYFAKLGLDNIVLEVVVVDNIDTMNRYGEEDETIGIQFLKNLTGHETWLRTSCNMHANCHSQGKEVFRKNMAMVGGYYDAERDAFIPPQTPGFVFDEDLCIWRPPAPLPEDANHPIMPTNYRYDPDANTWISVTE